MRLKEEYPHLPVGQLCGLFGKTRHAFYDHQWRKNDLGLQDEIILQLVTDVRKQLPRVGTRKLLHILTPRMQEHGIFIGRDYLFDLLNFHHLLIRSRKRKAITTNSKQWMRKYSNLIRELKIDRPEQLWVSDITYIRLVREFAYLSLVTDAYSKKIVGFCLQRDLSSEGCISALNMALQNRLYPTNPLIHHSDRGSQYCCKDYIDILTSNKIGISMTENGDPYENAIAERINGIIKSEFNLFSSSVGLDETRKYLTECINSYNTIRPHSSCDFLTPQQTHLKAGLLKNRWKPKKFNMYS